MVQDDMWKEKTYKLIAHSGIWAMQKIFPEYFATEPLQPTDRYIEYPWVLEHLGSEKRLDVLDIGSSGSMLPYLINALGHHVSSMDIRSRQDVETNKEITFYHRDICRSCLPDEFFDVVTAISTIEHIGLEGRYGNNEESTDEKAISEIYRILKPKGLFLMSVPYDIKEQITKTHKIYDEKILLKIMNIFNPIGVSTSFEQSPEANYHIALIETIK